MNDEELLRKTVAALPCMLTVIDREFTVVLRGRGLESPAETASRKCYRSTMGRDSHCEGCQAREVFETGTARVRVATDVEAGATHEIRTFPISDDAGRVLYVSELVLDITDRARTEQTLAREVEVRGRLVALGRALAVPGTTIENFAEAVLAHARAVTASAHGYVSMMDEATRENVRLAQTDMGAGTTGVSRSRFPPGTSGAYPSLWGHALNTHEAFYTNEPAAHPAARGLPVGHEPVESFLSVPAVIDGRLVGQVALANAEGGFDDADMEAVRELTDLFGLAVIKLRAEEELRRAEARTRLARRAAGVGIWGWDIPGDRIDWSPEIEQMWGYSPGEFRGLRDQVLSRIHPADLARWQRSVVACLRDSREQRVEFRVIWPDGSVHWLEGRGDVEREARGKAVRMGGTVTDITEAKRTQLERARLMMAIEQTGEEIVVTDRDGVIQFVNPAFERATGFTRQEAMGNTPRILKSGVHDDAFYAEMWAKLLSGESWNGRIVNKTKAGRLITEDMSISPVRDADGSITSFIAVKRDVTALLALEEQLRQSHKMQAVGLLAGGIAHDFNNTLHVISGYADLLLTDLPIEAGCAEELEEIRKAANNASELTQQLLAFSRRQIIRPIDLDVNALVGNLLKMVGRLIGEHIALQFVPGDDLATVHADPSQLEQVFLNLCVNARDAMPGGGLLAIETKNVEADDAFVASNPWATVGRYVLVRVSDTGRGMDEVEVSRVFEPFFTTKEQGKGTGLGLAMVYGVVEQHGGHVSVHSELGKGTSFQVYLPAVEGSAAPLSQSVKRAVQGGTETVLLAEDDELVRRLAVRTLGEAGYKVIVAQDGEEAVRLFERYAERIDVAVLDVVMPRMGGEQVIDRIRELRPAFPHLFVSGYSEEGIHTSFIQHEGVRLLRKPYERESLLRAIRALLDES